MIKVYLIVSPSLKAFVDSIDNLVPAFVLLTFGAALIMIIAQRRTVKLFLYGVLLLLAWLLKEDKTWLVPFAAFLPTLIHVFLFTGMFILVGALKNRSFSGILSLFIFISCAASFFFIQPDAEGYIVNDTLRYSYNMSLVNLNYTVLTTFLPTQLGDLRTADQILNFIYASKPGLILSRFLAFAYTYHYLNWFSKTSIIKWHLVPRKQLMVVGLLWLISVCLFVYDYNVGYLALYLLSTLHVIMELPLNFHSFRQAGEQIALLLKPKSG